MNVLTRLLGESYRMEFALEMNNKGVFERTVKGVRFAWVGFMGSRMSIRSESDDVEPLVLERPSYEFPGGLLTWKLVMDRIEVVLLSDRRRKNDDD